MALLDRISRFDSIAEFEAAMRDRYVEAWELGTSGRQYWGVYTFGYVVELLLKLAYLNTQRLQRHEDARPAVQGARARATDLLGNRPVNLHDLVFWSELLIAEREVQGRPYPVDFANELEIHVERVAQHWRVTMRYHPSIDVSHEVVEVSAAVEWLIQNHPALEA